MLRMPHPDSLNDEMVSAGGSDQHDLIGNDDSSGIKELKALRGHDSRKFPGR